MGKQTNYQDLLKLGAIVTMVVDHLGVYFFPEMMTLRMIGRYAMPIFGFFVGYNFKNSVNFHILFYGVILYLISTVFIIEAFFSANILISLFLGQLYLFFFQEQLRNLTKGWLHFIILVILSPFTLYLFDYGSLVIGIIVIGYMVKVKSIDLKIAAFVIAYVSLLHTVVNFSDLSRANLFFCGVVAIMVYLSLSYGNFEKKIALNIRPITCHALLIYCLHILIIEFIWRYYYVG
jgi:TraX protein